MLLHLVIILLSKYILLTSYFEAIKSLLKSFKYKNLELLHYLIVIKLLFDYI